MATLAAPLQSAEQWRNPNCVKVVCDAAGRALYFSRSPIPFVRDGQPDFAARPPRFLQHLGIYAYRRRFLLHAGRPAAAARWSSWKSWNSCASWPTAGASRSASSATPRRGVDTYDDYQRFVAAWRQNRQGRAA